MGPLDLVEVERQLARATPGGPSLELRSRLAESLIDRRHTSSWRRWRLELVLGAAALLLVLFLHAPHSLGYRHSPPRGETRPTAGAEEMSQLVTDRSIAYFEAQLALYYTALDRQDAAAAARYLLTGSTGGG